MGYPNRDNRSGGRGGGGNYGRSDFGGNRPVRHAEMHKAVCSTCGNECEIPFRPTGDRPVYCRDCFAKNRSADSGNSFGRDDRQTPRPTFKKYANDNAAQSTRNEQIESINSKLDQILKLLSTLTPQMPVEKMAIEAPVKKKRASKKAAIETPEETSI